MNCVALYLIFYGPKIDGFLSNVSNLRDLRGLYNLIDMFDLPFTSYSNSHSETQSSRIFTVCSSTNSRPKIYTVDAENSVKECIVVRGTDVVDSGSLGEAHRWNYHHYSMLSVTLQQRKF